MKSTVQPVYVPGWWQGVAMLMQKGYMRGEGIMQEVYWC